MDISLFNHHKSENSNSWKNPAAVYKKNKIKKKAKLQNRDKTGKFHVNSTEVEVAVFFFLYKTAFKIYAFQLKSLYKDAKKKKISVIKHTNVYLGYFLIYRKYSPKSEK